ncbi:unnamed protein product [Dracunculus medinensis]|uniref:Neur_chan_LBD domain-containing protein n=1 Tax=Dracunculus medinensis TaxID=318479 RepID=A0A0N4UPN3_DRAME|nr:unnamed protein product [Dracunculus medinensis]
MWDLRKKDINARITILSWDDNSWEIPFDDQNTDIDWSNSPLNPIKQLTTKKILRQKGFDAIRRDFKMRYNDMVEKKRDDRIAFKPLFSTEKINEDPPFELNYAFSFMHGRKSFFFGFSSFHKSGIRT